MTANEVLEAIIKLLNESEQSNSSEVFIEYDGRCIEEVVAVVAEGSIILIKGVGAHP